MDLTRASIANREPEAKLQRRYRPAALTDPRLAGAALGTGTTAHRQGVAVPTKTSGPTLVVTPATMTATPPPPAPGPSPVLPYPGDQHHSPGCHGTQSLQPPALETSDRPTPIPAVLRKPPKGPLGQEATGRNEEVLGTVSLLRHSHFDGLPKMS